MRLKLPKSTGTGDAVTYFGRLGWTDPMTTAKHAEERRRKEEWSDKRCVVSITTNFWYLVWYSEVMSFRRAPKWHTDLILGFEEDTWCYGAGHTGVKDGTEGTYDTRPVKLEERKGTRDKERRPGKMEESQEEDPETYQGWSKVRAQVALWKVSPRSGRWEGRGTGVVRSGGKEQVKRSNSDWLW